MSRAPHLIAALILALPLGNTYADEPAPAPAQDTPATDAPPAEVTYGGTDDTHNCGTLKYARIEYAGFAPHPDHAARRRWPRLGLRLPRHGSVPHRPADDRPRRQGDRGRQQPQRQRAAAAQRSAGLERDVHRRRWRRCGSAGWPHLRRGTAGKINNSIIAYFTKFAVDVDGTSSANQFSAGALALENVYFVKGTNATAAWPDGFDVGSSGESDCPTSTTRLGEATSIGGDPTNHVDVDPMLTAPKNLTAPSSKPMAGSPVLTGGGTPPAGFDTTATFCGAIGTTDWTTGWTRFPN